MKASFLLQVALLSIRGNKLRSALTVLGIVIGVASVIAMVAIGEGATASVKKAIASMGNNVLQIRPGAPSSGGFSWGADGGQSLTPEDAEAILSECPAIVAVSPIISHRMQIIYGDKNWRPGSMEGGGVDYGTVCNVRADQGGWFTEQDVRAGAKVCLLGPTLVDELFGGMSPVGEIIRIGAVPMEVIGVLSRRGLNSWGRDQDDCVVMPWSTMQMRFNAASPGKVERIIVSCISADAMERAEKEITAVLRDRHRLRSGDSDDFNIRDLSQIAETMGQTSKVMSVLLAVIASISLLVGGIGIMNIMLVTVSERTREIGIRMAVGARGRDILLQFLVESVVLSGIGGAIGIGLGVGASKAVSHYAKWATILSPESMVVAFGFSAAIGVIFGFYPSWRASKLDPIDCLRYE